MRRTHLLRVRKGEDSCTTWLRTTWRELRTHPGLYGISGGEPSEPVCLGKQDNLAGKLTRIVRSVVRYKALTLNWTGEHQGFKGVCSVKLRACGIGYPVRNFYLKEEEERDPLVVESVDVELCAGVTLARISVNNLELRPLCRPRILN